MMRRSSFAAKMSSSPRAARSMTLIPYSRARRASSSPGRATMIARCPRLSIPADSQRTCRSPPRHPRSVSTCITVNTRAPSASFRLPVLRVVVHLELAVHFRHHSTGRYIAEQLRELGRQVVALHAKYFEPAFAALAKVRRDIAPVGLLLHVVDLELDDAELVGQPSDSLSHDEHPPRAAPRAPPASPPHRCAR